MPWAAPFQQAQQQSCGQAQQYDPSNRSRFTAQNAPIVEFHGSVDGTINISHARDAQMHYAQTGVPCKHLCRPTFRSCRDSTERSNATHYFLWIGSELGSPEFASV